MTAFIKDVDGVFWNLAKLESLEPNGNGYVGWIAISDQLFCEHSGNRQISAQFSKEEVHRALGIARKSKP
jgi:hypothetical protein